MALGAVALAGLAVSGSGCIIGGSSGPCEPDLFVPFRIVQNAPPTDPPITCATAGAAQIEMDVNSTPVPSIVCSPSLSEGEFAVPLLDAGDYVLDLFLVDGGGSSIAEAHPPVIRVGCGDFVTPTVILPVNL
jgi:hypothetical protein